MIFKRLRSLAVLLVFSLAFMPVHGYCLPQGEQVVEGAATFDRSQANTLNINQATDKMIANYNSFSIAAPEAVNFMQPSSSSIALNRVVGVDPSLILGTLTANGRIFLINPNGVIFGQGCKVDTMGLVASSLNLSNADFMAGRYSFVGNGGSVVNLGYLSAPGGYVALLGSRVENNGIIEAELGSVALASGKAVTLKLDPKGLISVVIDAASISNVDNKDDAVKNSGTIKVNGGKVFLTAQALDGVFKKAVNTDGLIEANSIGDVMGEVTVDANQRVAIGGIINAIGGIVKVNCQGADFTGAINAHLGLYTMNDGDTDVTGGAYTGNHTWNDNLNINVSGVTTVTDGSININADNDHNGSGDLSISNGGLIANNGDIALTGVNISIKDSLISATKSFGSVSVYVKNTGNLTITGTGSGIADSSSITSTINGDGNAFSVFDTMGDISVTGHSTITSQVTGNGQTNVDLHSSAGFIKIGDESGLITTLKSSIGGNGLVDSVYIDAWLGLRTGTDDYSVGGGSVTVTNADILASVGGAGTAEIDLISGGLGNVDIGGSQKSFLTAETGSDSAEVDLETYVGDINISGASEVEALVDFDGKATVALLAHSGDVNISGSVVDSTVQGNGEAFVDFYDWRADNSFDIPFIGSIDLGGPLGGDINITGGSTVFAQVSNEIFADTAAIFMYTDGSINVVDSSVNATDMYGLAGVAMFAGEDINVIGAGNVGAASAFSSAGVIAIAGNSIHAPGLFFANGGSDGAGAVALLAGSDIYANIEASGGLNVIGPAQDLFNYYVFGPDDMTQKIEINSQYTYGSFALLGSLMGNITLGDISADAVVAAALGLGGEGTGSIFDAGTVSAHYLSMLAACDIGNSEAPIQTDVDIVSAYSYAKGDIYINQNNAGRMLELGLYLPITLYNFEEDGEDGDIWLPYEDQIGIGASVAAKDGIVHITTEGDMKVNSIIALNGGVFLESRNGNIYTGRGWCPIISEITIDSTAEIVGSFVDFLFSADDDEITDTDEVVADLIGDFLMDGSSLGSEDGGIQYLSPFMIDFPLEKGANVWAAGYSYFSTPNGTIGVEAADDIALQGAITGIVRPGISADVSPRPGFDLVPVSGFVTYKDADTDCYGPLEGYPDVDPGLGTVQIWPDLGVESFEFKGPQNPLEVCIQLVEGAASAAPVRGDEYEQPFSPVAGLTLNYAIPALKPVPPGPTPEPLDQASEFTEPLSRNLRAYYEILSTHRFVSNEPATPTTFFGYRPLTPTNMAAFDDMKLDIGAYDFISNNIKPKKPLSPYFGS